MQDANVSRSGGERGAGHTGEQSGSDQWAAGGSSGHDRTPRQFRQGAGPSVTVCSRCCRMLLSVQMIVECLCACAPRPCTPSSRQRNGRGSPSRPSGCGSVGTALSHRHARPWLSALRRRLDRSARGDALPRRARWLATEPEPRTGSARHRKQGYLGSADVVVDVIEMAPQEGSQAVSPGHRGQCVGHDTPARPRVRSNTTLGRDLRGPYGSRLRWKKPGLSSPHFEGSRRLLGVAVSSTSHASMPASGSRPAAHRPYTSTRGGAERWWARRSWTVLPPGSRHELVRIPAFARATAARRSRTRRRLSRRRCVTLRRPGVRPSRDTRSWRRRRRPSSARDDASARRNDARAGACTRRRATRGGRRPVGAGDPG